jgi:hypothetical protein
MKQPLAAEVAVIESRAKRCNRSFAWYIGGPLDPTMM